MSNTVQATQVGHFPNRSGRQRRKGVRRPQQALTPQQKSEVSRMVKRAITIAPELKYLTTGLNTTFGGVTTFTTLSLTDVPQSAGASTDVTRIGDFINARSLELHFNIVRNPATANVAEFVRLLVVQRHAQFSVDPPTSANLFLNDPVSTVINFRSFFIQDGRSLSTVLWDQTFDMTGLTATTEGAIYEKVNISLASARKKLNYINGSTTNGTENIFLYYCCSTATTPPTLTLAAKFQFTDM